LKAPDLVLEAFNLRLDAPDLVRDLLRELAIPAPPGVGKRFVQAPQFVLEPLQLATQFRELRAGRIVGSLAGFTRARGLSGLGR
jgi:hypothetical protein